MLADASSPNPKQVDIICTPEDSEMPIGQRHLAVLRDDKHERPEVVSMQLCRYLTGLQCTIEVATSRWVWAFELKRHTAFAI